MRASAAAVSDAGVAETADVDLDLALLDGTRRLGAAARGELELGETLDGPAFRADEVRVCRVVLVGHGFETPHVVTDVGAAQKSRIREIDQVAIDRGAVGV